MNKKMKMGSQLWNAILAILIGILFVIWPASIIGWAVLFVGILSFLTGLTQLIVYISTRKKQPGNTFPFFGLLLLLWSISLLLQPGIWVNLFMVVMSIPMILLAIAQIVLLNRRRKVGFTVRWGHYIFPVLFLISGIIVMFNPFASAVWLVFYVGIWVIAYGIAEMINSFSIRS